MHKCTSPHGDFDHMGEAINLVNNFKVEKVIFNCGDFDQQDIIDIAHGTTKEDELFDYAYIPDYHKSHNEDKDIDNDLDISI